MVAQIPTASACCTFPYLPNSFSWGENMSDFAPPRGSSLHNAWWKSSTS